MTKDLRSFLDEVERNEPDQVLHIREKVSPKFEVTAVLEILEQEHRYPVIVYEDVPGLNGKKSHRLVSNLTARRQNLGLLPYGEMHLYQILLYAAVFIIVWFAAISVSSVFLLG